MKGMGNVCLCTHMYWIQDKKVLNSYFLVRRYWMRTEKPKRGKTMKK